MTDAEKLATAQALDAAPHRPQPSRRAMTLCPSHPAIELPHLFTCPLCAQEARTATYAKQQAESAARMPAALQPPLRPAQGDVTGLSGDAP